MRLNWLKIQIDILDNSKIKRIRRMPGGSDLFVLWIGILTLGMKCDNSGRLEISDGIPYNADDLSSEFDLPVDTVQLGLKVFAELKMIEMAEGNTIEISNFRRFQSVESIEHARELARIRQEKRREKLKLEFQSNKDHLLNSKEKDKDGERERDIEVTRDKTVTKEVVANAPRFQKPSPEQVQEYLTSKGITQFTGEDFFNFYESKGWFIGKNKMVNWKAAVATWKKRERYGKKEKPIIGLGGTKEDYA